MIREMTVADLPQVFDVRVATLENAVSKEYLEDLGITPDQHSYRLYNPVSR